MPTEGGGIAYRLDNAEKRLARIEQMVDDVAVIRRDVELGKEELTKFRRVYVATFTGLGLTIAGAVIAIIVSGGA